MSNVLVFLPEEFNCYSKIDRKLTRITSSFSNFKLSCPHDSHSLLKQYYAQNTNCTDLIICEEWKNLEYTHVVIFDDGEVFTEEVSFFQKNKIPLRVIPVKITRVINIHHHPKFQNIKKSDEY